MQRTQASVRGKQIADLANTSNAAHIETILPRKAPQGWRPQGMPASERRIDKVKPKHPRSSLMQLLIGYLRAWGSVIK